MAREPKDPSRLLEGLEAIRSLLDDQPTTSSTQHAAAQPEIPLLQDVIGSGRDAPTYPAGAEDTSGKSPNPFLPYESLARLAGERVHLERLLHQQFHPSVTTQHTGAREVRLEARLHAEAQLILQDVMDEMLPVIEAELHKRLSVKLKQIVQKQLNQP